MNNSSEEKKADRVLIVDDDETLRTSVSRALTRSGFAVTGVSNGIDCLSELRKGFKGVILMDVVMPEMDGWTTIQNIVAENLMDGCAICMVTGQTEPPPIGMDLEPFITDYLAKPFDLKDLISMVKTAVLYLESESQSAGS
jgi:DNA-binding response OmpR family regulator